MTDALAWSTIFLEYVCPSIGALLSGIMFAAPIQDLRKALIKGSLGLLNPLPFSMMTGNCIGWCAYAYYTQDPFVLAGNLPGVFISLWLNFGAIKLQYLNLFEGIKRRQQQDQQHETPPPLLETEKLTMVPQEVTVLRVMILWAFVLLWVGWFHPTTTQNASQIVGLVVNVNLVFFYGAPLNTIMQVIQTKCSDSIHVPTMVLNWVNTSFWLACKLLHTPRLCAHIVPPIIGSLDSSSVADTFLIPVMLLADGVARRDFYIMIPNGCGLMLGLLQGLLSLLYPRSGRDPLVQEEEPLEVDDSDGEQSRDSLIV